MSAFTEFSFATLEQLKRRLNITSDDYDEALTDALRFSSAAIERAANRRLRRFPAKVERFTGGSKLIRLAVSPLAKMHYLRESYDRNFTDPDLYTELVEGTDYVLETGEDGEYPGSSGLVRRILGNWAGSTCEPGMIEAQYTGGYKTDDEEAAENASETYSNASQMRDYQISKTGSVYKRENDTADVATVTTAIPYIIRIDTSDTISPAWSIQEVVLNLKMSSPDDDTFAVSVYILPIDAAKSSLGDIYESIGTPVESVVVGAKLLGTFVGSGIDYADYSVSMTSSADSAESESAIESSIVNGHISLAFLLEPASASTAVNIKTVDTATGTDKPSIRVDHYTSFYDPFNVTDDLRLANLIQASHDHYIRSNPGALFEAQRGVAIASGSTIQKKEAGLLPYVLDIAKKYRRLY